MRAMTIRHPHFRRESISPRVKLALSEPDNEPIHTAQIWTGCILQTPPGWSLWVRSPINREYSTPFRIDEAVIETDWMQNDLWINLRFHRFGEVAKIRRNGAPLVQIVPVPRATSESWPVQDRLIDPSDPEAQAVFDRWVDYDWEKFDARADGKRDPTTYHRLRKKLRSKEASACEGALPSEEKK